MTNLTATAAVLYEIKKPLVIEEVELLPPGPHEVQVRWAANGVCHSDYHLMSGDSPHPLPVVLGHEASGVVEKIGVLVESVEVGDHVCSSYIPSCGKCGYCINGTPTLCALRDKPRSLMHDGTFRFRKKARDSTSTCRSAATRRERSCRRPASFPSARTPRSMWSRS